MNGIDAELHQCNLFGDFSALPPGSISVTTNPLERWLDLVSDELPGVQAAGAWPNHRQHGERHHVPAGD